MQASRQISRGLLLRAEAAPLQARRHAFFNSLLMCCPINNVAFRCDQKGPPARRLPGTCRTRRWEGSRPRPAAAGSFLKPSACLSIE